MGDVEDWVHLDTDDLSPRSAAQVDSADDWEFIDADNIPAPLLQEAVTPADQGEDAVLAAALKEAHRVTEGVVQLLEEKRFHTEPPPQEEIFQNALWLKERVESTDSLDPKTPFTIVHWSALEQLGRLPRNPDDQQCFHRAVDIIDEYINGQATSSLVICMISHRWRRPTAPHPDDKENSKARSLARYGKDAAQRNVDMYFWLDFAGVNQDDLRDKVVGISKLPCIVATCNEFLVFWSDDYESRAWTRLERYIGYILSPCKDFKVIDSNYGRKVSMRKLQKTGVVHQSSIWSPITMKIMDPLQGAITCTSDKAHLESLVQVGMMFPPVAYRGVASTIVAFDTSSIDLVLMEGAKVRRSKTGHASLFTNQTGHLSASGDKDGYSKAVQETFNKNVRQDLVMGFGFTVKWFILYNILRSLLPLVCNGAWVAMAGLGNCGSRQSFWTFALGYDAYFIILKGCMITCYFFVFMPPPTPERKEYTARLHLLMVAMMFLFNVLLAVLWLGLELHNEGVATWLLYKVNFPVSALLTFVAFSPLYLKMNYEVEKRPLARRRYVLLSLVLVCDVFFIATSHAYVFFFRYAMEEWVPELEGNFILQNGAQVALVLGFTMLYMPLLGKIWWFGIYLVDKLAPMPDLQHQQFIYFATVICDMHRLMYSRELFVNLDSYYLFYLILLKDFSYMMYQFGIKAHPMWQTLVVGIFHPEGLARPGKRGGLILFGMKMVRCFAEMMEMPKLWLSWNRTIIDAGFSDEDGGQLGNISYFCCDTLIEIQNLPSAFSGKYAKLKDVPATQRRAMIKKWVKESNSGVVANNSAESLQPGSPQMMPLERCKESAWDVSAADAGTFDFDDNQSMASSAQDMTPTASTATGGSWPMTAMSSSKSMRGSGRRASSVAVPVTWETEFYSYITMRLNGIIFLRAQARMTVSIASALSYIFMGLIIRSTGSKRVLNFVKDHNAEIETRVLVAGISFLLIDVMTMALLNYHHLADRRLQIFHLAKFGRLFQSKAFFYMLALCTVCCNSDIYLTYPDMDFCN
mmetsp:Transcript_34044/g.79625  ORF Transcript_34044/g.79625 Transcript_34044/m.79625 type:complete len:1032 (-) Transcript_34044:158-3253(-)